MKKIMRTDFLIYVFLFLSGACITAPEENHTQRSEHSRLTQWLTKTQHNIVKKVLPNGLTVLCYPLPNTFKVQIGITYKVGSKDEQAGEYGLAHMVEHMIFKGTEKMSETDLKAISEKFCIGGIGRGYNAHTTSDQTAYFFNTDKFNWPVFLNILADCMFNVRFDENHFASEVKTVINELNMRKARPGTCMNDMLGHETLPIYHPYAHSTGGTKPDLLTATSADLKKFYKRYYHPSQAILIIVGDIDVETALQTTEESLKQYPITQEYKNKECDICLWAPEELMQKKVTIYKPIPRATYSYVWLTPEIDGIEEIANAARYALYYRLSKILKDELDLVYSFNIDSYSMFLQGFFCCAFEPKHKGDETSIKTSVKAIKKIITEEIHKLAINGTTDEELFRFKKIYETTFLQSFEDSESIWSILENNYFPHRNELEFFNKLKRVKNITHHDIKSFCSHYLQSITMNQFRCLPIPESELPGWLENQAAQDAYEQKILAQKVRESAVEAATLVDQLPKPKLIEFSAHEPDHVLTLSNGLTVYLKFRDTTPFVQTSLHFKNFELFGLYLALNKQVHSAMYAISQLTQASTGYSKEETRNFFHENGASYNFSGSGSSFECLADDYTLIGKRFLHVLTAPEYPEKMLNQAIGSALDSLKHAQEEPGHVAMKTLTQHLLKAYPWIIDDEETMQQLASITRNDLLSLNKQFVHPDNLFAVIVGNYDQTNIADQLEDIFGSWKAGDDAIIPDYSSLVIPELDLTTNCNQELFLPKEQIMILGGRITPEFETDDRMALKLLEQYLQKKLFEIRERTGLFYSAHSTLAGQTFKTKEMALIKLQVSVDNVVEAEAAIKQVLLDIAHNGIPADQLSIAKQTYQMMFVKGYSTNSEIATNYSYLLEHEKPWNFTSTYIKKIQAISNDEVNAIAQKYLDPKTWSFVKVGRISA